MEEMVAGAFLSVVFTKLFEQLASPELRKNSVASKLKELEGKLKKARLLLDDAEDRQLTEPSIKEWLDELKHLVFMAVDLVEKIEHKSNRKAWTLGIKFVYHFLAKTVQVEVDLISKDVDVLLDRAIVLELKQGNTTSQSHESSATLTAPLREEHHVFGRQADKGKIMEMLLSNDIWGNKIGVLPIVGMGGLGKTTVAQLLYDDARDYIGGFELKAWVTVSTEFDVVRMLKAVLQQINPTILTSDVVEPTQLQRLMKEALRGKRFFVVLDDVWDENYNDWDLLMSNFTTGETSSRE